MSREKRNRKQRRRQTQPAVPPQAAAHPSELPHETPPAAEKKHLHQIAAEGGIVAIPATMVVEAIDLTGEITGLPVGFTPTAWTQFWKVRFANAFMQTSVRSKP